MIAPEIVAGTVDDDSIHGNFSTGSHKQLDHTLRTEMTRSRQYSRIILKRKEKPLDRRFLKKSFRYTGYYQQQADKADKEESSESESEDGKHVNQQTCKVTGSHDNVMGLIQSVESLSNFFDVPSASSIGSCELQPVSCDPNHQSSTTSEGSSGYESMDSPMMPSNTVNTTPLTGSTGAGGSRIKARKRTKPIPRPRQHRPTNAGTQQCNETSYQQSLDRQQIISTTVNPQLLTTCAAGIGCYGNDGGILSADNSLVTVKIPEGAIPLNVNPYIVQYEVCTDYRPAVPPTHAISPLVHVKSSNTTFTTSIDITIPHHIHNIDSSSCVVLATKQDLTTQNSVEFTVFPVTKETRVTKPVGEITCFLTGSDLVTISTQSLQDFQWLMLASTVSNEAIVRQCRVLVFHSRPKHGNFIIKVTIVEDCSDAIQVSILLRVGMATDIMSTGSHTSPNM